VRALHGVMNYCLSTEAVEDELSCQDCMSIGSTKSSAPPMRETPGSSRRQDPEHSSAQWAPIRFAVLPPF